MFLWKLWQSLASLPHTKMLPWLMRSVEEHVRLHVVMEVFSPTASLALPLAFLSSRQHLGELGLKRSLILQSGLCRISWTAHLYFLTNYFFFVLHQDCLDRSFKADVYSCPACRYDLGKNYTMQVNETLQTILTQLFPGYGNGRWFCKALLISLCSNLLMGFQWA